MNIISMGMVVAVAPTDPEYQWGAEDIGWGNFFGEMGMQLNSEVVVRELHERFDVPNVIGLHDKPVSFPPGTRFISLTAAVVGEGEDWPEYQEQPEQSGIIIAGSAHRVRREIVDKQDRMQGLHWKDKHS